MKILIASLLLLALTSCGAPIEETEREKQENIEEISESNYDVEEVELPDGSTVLCISSPHRDSFVCDWR